MEKNAWEVGKQVTVMVDDEPGPAKDYIKCYITLKSSYQFFFNKSYLVKYANDKTDAAKRHVPRYHYFKKIYLFMDCHCIIGEMFLEYLKGACKKMGEKGIVEHFVTSATKANDAEKRLNILQDHFLIKKVMRNIIFLCLKHQQITGTLTITSHGPRVQQKAAYASGQCCLDDPTSISAFFRKFVVAEGCVRNYIWST